MQTSRALVRRLGEPFGLCTIMLLLTGCGSGQQDATARQVSALKDQIVELRNRGDRLEERLSALEVGQRAERPPRAETAREAVIERPPLKVVRVVPGSSADSAAARPAACKEEGDITCETQE